MLERMTLMAQTFSKTDAEDLNLIRIRALLTVVARTEGGKLEIQDADLAAEIFLPSKKSISTARAESLP